MKTRIMVESFETLGFIVLIAPASGGSVLPADASPLPIIPRKPSLVMYLNHDGLRPKPPKARPNSPGVIA